MEMKEEVKEEEPETVKTDGVILEELVKEFSGLTYAQKLEAYKTKFQSGDVSVDVLVELIDKLFPGNEKNRLWDRLKWVMKKAGPDTKDRWEKLCAMKKGQGQQLEKNRVLAINLAYPHNWELMAAKESRAFSNIKSHEEEGLPFTE